MQKLFLGIDQSFTSSGICILDEHSNVVHHETINTTDADGDIFDRAIKVVKRIEEIIHQYEPVRVGIEGLAFSKFGNATRDLAGLQFVIITHLRRTFPDFGTKLDIISPNLLKKFASGKGSASKDDMFAALSPEYAAIFTCYKKTKGRSDVVDAFWLAKMTLSIYNNNIV